MQKLEELDMLCLNYKVPYLIEAYNIFYGRWPSFSCDMKEQNMRKLEFQLMICILSEYNILNKKYRWNFDHTINIPYSMEANYQVNFLISIMKNINIQEIELEKVCREHPLSDKQKDGINAIAYIIRKQIEREKIEHLDLLKQICDIIYFRKILFVGMVEDDDFSTKFSESLVSSYPELEFSRNLIKERVDFITSKLRLLINTYPISVDGVIVRAKQEGMNAENLCFKVLDNQDNLRLKLG